MSEESTSFIKEAIKEGDLMRARKLLVNALKNEVQPETLGPLLGELAYKFKQEGLFENAVEVLEKKCKLTGDKGDKTALKFWLEELNMIGWFMARRDSQHTSRSTTGIDQKLNFQHLWSYSFPHGPMAIQETMNLPSPVIARDMLIIFNEYLQGFIGLEIRSGVIQWESGIVANSLDYSMSPVYSRPDIFFAVPGSIKRMSVYNSGGVMETVASSTYIQMTPYLAPLVWNNAIIFSFLSHVFVYDQESNRGTFYSISLKKDEMLRSPVVCNNDLFFLSNLGRVFQFPREQSNSEMICIKELPSDNDTVYSVPCVVGDSVYFEALNKDGLRQIGCYMPYNNHYVLSDLINEFCNVSHSHFNFSPMSVGDSALFCSDTHPRLYKARQAGDMIEIVPINIRSQIPSINAAPLPQIYSSVINSHFLSKSIRGFLYINLINGSATFEAFQQVPWEIISQPIVYGNKILFGCKEGVICYGAL